MQAPEYKVLDHTADLSLEAYGATLPELFKNALKGMFSILKPTGPYIAYQASNDESKLICTKFTVERHVHTRSDGFPLLLVDFLSDCLYLSDVHNEAYFDVKFSVLEPDEVQATIYGTPITGYEVSEIKAVTYHELVVEEVEGGWRARLTFDI